MQGVQEPSNTSAQVTLSVVQSYETTITESNLRTALSFLVVPARVVPNQDILQNLPQLTKYLQLELIQELPSPFFLPQALVSLLIEKTPIPTYERFQQLLEAPQKEAYAGVDPGLVAFAQYVAAAELIPFEASGLTLHSLMSICASHSGMGMGAAAGLVAGWGTPLILITVPLGMILGGAAQGLAEGLRAGLRERTGRLMGVSGPIPY